MIFKIWRWFKLWFQSRVPSDAIFCLAWEICQWLIQCYIATVSLITIAIRRLRGLNENRSGFRNIVLSQESLADQNWINPSVAVAGVAGAKSPTRRRSEAHRVDGYTRDGPSPPLSPPPITRDTKLWVI